MVARKGFKAGAGSLAERLLFERPALDARGRKLGGWAPAFTIPAGRFDRPGGETAISMRAQGQNPAEFWVRANAATREIDNSWRCTDVRTGAVYTITAVQARAARGGYIDITAHTGGKDAVDPPAG